LAQARRVDLRVLTPWSSWEDRTATDQSPVGSRSPSTAASSVTEAPSALPREVQRSDAPVNSDAPANTFDSSAGARLPGLLRTITPRDLGGE
jgi:hypothetical protein